MADQIDKVTGLPEEKKSIDYYMNAPKPTRAYIDDPISSVNLQNQFIQTTDPGSSYDFNIVRGGWDPNERRANEQPIAEKVAKGFGRVINSAAFSVAEGLGMLYGLGSGLAYGDATKIYDNALSNAIDGAREYIDEELLKVYVPPSVQAGDFWDKLGSASFWTTDAADTLGFALGMLVPGQAVKLANLGKRFSQMSKIPAKFRPGWIADKIDSTAAVALNTLFEAGAEARGSYMNLYDQMVNEGMSDEDAKKIAGNAAAEVFQGNIALLAASNTLFERFVFKGFNANPGNILLKRARAGADTAEEFVNNMTKLTTKDMLKEYGKRSVGGFLSEGFLEEGTQFAIEEAARNRALDGSKQSFIADIADTYLENIFTNTDMNISVFLGGLFGMGMSAPGTAAEFRGANRTFFGTEEQKVSKLRKFLGGKDIQNTPGLKELYDKNIVQFHKTVESLFKVENGKIAMNNGVPVLDHDKLRNFIQEKGNQQTLVVEAAKALQNKDQFGYEWAQAKVAYDTFRDTLASPYGETLLNEMIPMMAKQAATNIKEEFAQEVNEETIARDVESRLNTFRDLAKKAHNAPNDPVRVKGGTEDQKVEFSNAVTGLRESLALEEAFVKDRASELDKNHPKDSEEPKPSEKQLEELEETIKQWNSPKYLQDHYDMLLKLREQLDIPETGDIYEKDGQENVVVEQDGDKTTVVTPEGDIKTTEDPGEYKGSLPEDEESVLPENLDPKNEEGFINLANQGSKMDSNGKVRMLKALRPYIQNLDHDVVRGMLDKISDPEMKALIESMLNEPEQLVNEAEVVVSTNEEYKAPGRTLEDLFFPMNIDTSKGPLTKDSYLYDVKRIAVNTADFINRNRDNLDQYKLRALPVQGFDKGIRLVITRNGQSIDSNGNPLEGFDDPNRLQFMYRDIYTDNEPGKGIHKSIIRNLENRSIDIANVEDRIQQAHKEKMDIVERVAKGETVEFNITGASTGVYSNVRKQKSNWRTFNEITGKTDGKIEVEENSSNARPAGSIIVEGLRYFSKSVSPRMAETITNILTNADINNFERSIASNDRWYTTLTNLVYFNPNWKKNNRDSFIKSEGEKILIRTNRGVFESFEQSDREGILNAVTRMNYQIFANTSKTQGDNFVMYDVAEDGETDTEASFNQPYSEFALKNLMYTLDYPVEENEDGTINYPLDGVYPRIEAIQPAAVATKETAESYEEYVPKSKPKATESTEGAKPTSNDTFLSGAPAGKTFVKIQSTKEAAPIRVTKEGNAFINMEAIDYINTNVSRTLGAFFEIEGSIADGFDVISNPKVKKNPRDGSWDIIERGLLRAKPKTAVTIPSVENKSYATEKFTAFNDNSSHGQDALKVYGGSFVIADGVSAHENSKEFADAIANEFYIKDIMGVYTHTDPKKLIREAWDAARDKVADGATTLTYVRQDNTNPKSFGYLQIGDSPIYVVSADGTPRMIVGESSDNVTEALVSEDLLPTANINDISYESGLITLEDGEHIIIASDGLSDVLSIYRNYESDISEQDKNSYQEFIEMLATQYEEGINDLLASDIKESVAAVFFDNAAKDMNYLIDMMNQEPRLVASLANIVKGDDVSFAVFDNSKKDRTVNIQMAALPSSQEETEDYKAPQLHRRSEVFNNNQLDRIANSVVGHVLRNFIDNYDNNLNVDGSISLDELDKAYKKTLSYLVSRKLIERFDENDRDAILAENQELKAKMQKAKKEIIQLTSIKLKMFDLAVEETDIDETQPDNTGWANEDAKINIINSIPKRIRMLLGSFEDKHEGVETFDRELSVKQFIDPAQVFTITANMLAGSRSIEEQMRILEENAYKLSEYHELDFTSELFKRLNWEDGKLNVTPRTMDMQTEFQQAFANQEFSYNIYFSNEDNQGNKKIMLYQDSSSARIKRQATSAFRSAFNNGRNQNAVLKQGKWIHNKKINASYSDFIGKKISNEADWAKYLNYMEYLGIRIPAFYKKDGDPITHQVLAAIAKKNKGVREAVKQLRSDLKAIHDYIENNESANIHDFTYDASAEGAARLFAAKTSIINIYGALSMIGRENQFVNLNNDTLYTVGRHNHLSTQVARFNNIMKSGDVNELDRTVFDTGSNMVQRMKDGKISEVVIETSTGLKNMTEKIAAEFSNSSEVEKLAVFANNILNHRYPLIRPSDNGQERVIKFIKTSNGDPGGYIADGNKTDNPGLEIYINAIFGYLQDQIAAVNDKRYSDYGRFTNRGENPHAIPFFNYLDADLRDRLLNSEMTEDLEAEVRTALTGYHKVEVAKLKQQLIDMKAFVQLGNGNFHNRILNSLTANGKQIKFDPNEQGMSIITEGVLNKVVEKMLQRQTVNIIEQSKMFSGNPIYYDTALKMLKRMSGMVGPRATARVDSAFNEALDTYHKRADKKAQDGFFRTAVFNDPQSIYPYIKDKKDTHDEADAVTFINDDFQREFELRNGLWDFKKEIVYLKTHNKGKLTANFKKRYGTQYKRYLEAKGKSEFKIYDEFLGNDGFIMPPIKPFFFGKFAQTRPGMIKTAFVNVDRIGNDKIKNLSKYMRDKKLDMVTFPTAVKIGVNKGKTTNLFDADGNIITADPGVVVVGEHQNLGLQVSNQAKHKTKISTGSQQLKIQVDYLFKEGKPLEGTMRSKRLVDGVAQEWDATYEEAYENFLNYHNTLHTLLEQDLMFELGFFRGADNKWELSMEHANFINTLRKQAEARGLSDNTLDMIDYIDAYGIEATNQKLQSVLFKMIDTAVVNAKTFGNGYFQNTGTLARIAEGNSYTKDGVTFNGSDLKYYEPGEEQTGAMEVYLPWYMKGETPDINSLPKEALEGYGFRIPTQDINSLDAFVIKGFLPREAGNMVIVPTEYYKKNGADSDGDKLFIHLPQLDKNNEVISIEIPPEKPKLKHMKRLVRQDKNAYSAFMDAFGEFKSLQQEHADLMTEAESADEHIEMLGAIDEEYKAAIRYAYRQIENIFEDYGLLQQYENIRKTNPLMLQSKAALQNARMMQSRSFVLNPNVFNQLVKPLDSNFFSSVRDDLVQEGIAQGEPDFHDLFNPVRMIELTEEFLTGKIGIGFAATHRVHHIVSAVAGATMDVTANFPGVPPGTYSLGRDKDLNDDKMISEVLSDYVNIHVDAVADPMLKSLGIDSDTVNIVAALIRVGAPIENILYTIQQPPVKEFFRRLKVSKSALIAFQLNEKYTAEKIYDIVVKQFGLDKTKPQDISELTVDALKIGAKGGLSKGAQLGLLQSIVGSPSGKRGLLANGWMQHSSKLLQFMKHSSQDRVTAGKNLAEFLSTNLSYHIPLEINPGTMFAENGFLQRIKSSYNRIQSGLGNFFTFAQPANLTHTMTVVDRESISLNPGTETEYLSSLYEHAITYQIQTNGLSSRREELLTGPNNIAKRLFDMLKDPEVGSNQFLRTLTPSIEPKPEYKFNGKTLSGILHTRDRVTGTQENAMIEAFRDLFDSSREDVREFARDLADAAYLMYGHGNSPIGYTYLIPASVQREIFDRYGVTKDVVLPEEYPLIFNAERGFIYSNSIDTPINSVFKYDDGISNFVLEKGSMFMPNNSEPVITPTPTEPEVSSDISDMQQKIIAGMNYKNEALAEYLYDNIPMSNEQKKLFKSLEAFGIFKDLTFMPASNAMYAGAILRTSPPQMQLSIMPITIPNIANTMLHEMIHLATPKLELEENKDIKAIQARLKEYYDANPGGNDSFKATIKRMINEPQEVITHALTDPGIMEYLKRIDSVGVENLFDKILQFLVDLFGVSKSLLDDVVTVFNNELLSQPGTANISQDTRNFVEIAKAAEEKINNTPEIRTGIIEAKVSTVLESVTPEEKTSLAEELSVTEEELPSELFKESIKETDQEKRSSLLSRIINAIRQVIVPFVTGIMMFSSINVGGVPTNQLIPNQEIKQTLTIEDVNDVQFWQNEANKMNDGMTIMAWHERNNPDETYLMLDKSNTRLHVMKGADTLDSYEVLIGANIGDQQTVTTSDYNREMSNFMTGSGIYEISRATEKNPSYYDQPSFNFTNAQGIEVPTSIHATPKNRLYRFDNNNEEDNRVSWGCMNGKCADLNALYNNPEVDKGTKLYILPETDQAYFEISNGILVHKSDDPAINRSVETLNYIPTIITSPTNQGEEFAYGLQANKQQLMKDVSINGDVYDNIARVAYGIFGQESSFGTYGGPRGQFGRLRDLIGNQLGKNVSYGPTQIRSTSLDWNIANQYGITSIEDLDDPQNAAVATMIMLGQMYNNQISKDMKPYYQQILPVLWSNQGLASRINKGEFTDQLKSGTFEYSYVDNVTEFGNQLDIFQVLDQIDQCN